MLNNCQNIDFLSFRPDIEGLRGVAVLLVLLFHARVPGFQYGFVGVDVFFVISGFVISLKLLKEYRDTNTVDLPHFYGWRFQRLLPASVFFSLLTTAAAYFVFYADPIAMGRVLNDLGAVSSFWANMHFAAMPGGYFFQSEAPSLFLHYWYFNNS